MMSFKHTSIILLSIAALIISVTNAFVPLHVQKVTTFHAGVKRSNNDNISARNNSKTQVHLFRKLLGLEKKEKDDDEDSSKTNGATTSTTALGNENKGERETTNENDSSTTSSSPSTDFFVKKVDKDEPVMGIVVPIETTSSPVAESPTSPPPPPPTPEPTKPKQTPLERAQAMKAQAEKFRLEAEKMDIVLTLDKISKLETQLTDPKVIKDESLKEDLQNQIQSLKKKLSGETNTVDPKKEEKKKDVETGSNVEGSDVAVVSVNSSAESADKINTDNHLTAEDIQDKVKDFEKAPKFMQDLVVKAAGYNNEEYNVTDVVSTIYKDEKKTNGVTSTSTTFTTSTSTDTEEPNYPEFTQEQIDEVKASLQMVPKFLKNMASDDADKNNDTAMAIQMLQEEWREGRLKEKLPISQEEIDRKLEEVKWMPRMLKGDNDTELAIQLIEMERSMQPQAEPMKDVAVVPGVERKDETQDESKGTGFSSLFDGINSQIEKSPTDNLIEGCFPKETRRDNEPTEAEMKLLMEEVLAKDSTWISSGSPEKVPGGYIVRGSTRYETGTELIDAIDKNLAKSRVRNRASIFYVFDPTPVTEEQTFDGDRPPVLFVMGPRVVRDPAPFALSLVSSLAFGTLWFNSLYPFLLNEKYMKMAEEQMALADASMPSNMEFLNEMAFPLFLTSVGIQLSHELAHKAVASANGMNITFPTLVPSFTTGLTGGITSLTAPPKDKQALFDFALAGPLTGMFVSVLLLFGGAALTSSMDAASYANLPSLPLALLRSSSLAGGVVEAVIPNLLDKPDVAIGSKEVSEVLIKLHPLGIAGFFGLMINALNLLPVGRTDGGRLGLTLFGRTGCQLVSFLTLIGVLLQGVAGSDLLLFYFSFIIFFQNELEIPQRNEVDDMDFSRALMATGTGVLVLLTLIPM